MGVVYKARQRSLNRLVALKMILAGDMAGPEHLERFRAEAEALAQLRHANIVQIFDVGAEGGRPYFSFEYMDGGSLAAKLAGTPLAERRAAEVTLVLARAVQAAHECGIVHRDLKPANVLLTADGTVKVTDFGLAKRLGDESGRTQTGAVLGTPSYMAPEQAGGRAAQAGAATDVYALGAMLYEFLTGRPPFRAANPLDTLRLVVEQEPVAPRRLQPRLSRDLETICLKCLQKDARHRYPSAAALADELGRFLGGRPIRARPVGAPAQAWRWCRRRPALAALLFTAAASLLGGAAVSSYFAFQASRRLERAVQSERLAQEETARADDKAREALANARLADERREAAARAQGEADRLRDLARQELDTARRRVYGSQMRMAQLAWERGRIVEAGRLLALQQSDFAQLDLRGWEWRYLRALCHQERAALRGHTSFVDLLAWSPDGAYLASATSDRQQQGGALRVWDAEAGRELFAPAAPRGAVTALAWSPDGRTLAAAGADASLTLWDVPRRSRRHDLRRHAGPVTALAWSPGGEWLASAGEDKAVVVWQAAGGTAARAFTDPAGPVLRLAWDPKSALLAGSGRDHTLRIWDAAAGRLVRALAPSAPVLPDAGWAPAFAWAPAGGRLAWEARADTIELIDPAADGPAAACTGHAAGASWVGFSPDGRHVAAASRGSVRVWDAARGGPAAYEAPGDAAAWGQPAGLLVTGSSAGEVLRVHDVGTKAEARKLVGHVAPVYALAWDGARGRLASAGADATVRIWAGDPEPPGRTARLPLPPLGPAEVWDVAWGPGARRLALAVSDGTVRTWDVRSQKLEAVHRQHANPPRAIDWSPDGKLLASSDWQGEKAGSLVIWDMAAGREHRTLAAQGPSDLLRWSPDSRLLAARAWAKGESTLVVWDPGADRLRALTKGSAVHYIAWGPDSTRIACRSGSGVDILDTATGKVIKTYYCPGVGALAWSPDGKWAAVAGRDDNTSQAVIELIELDSRVTKTLEPHGPEIGALFWSHDGARLASYGAGRVKLWDPRTGGCVLDLACGLGGGAWDARWEPAGGALALATNEGVHVWDPGPGPDAEGRTPGPHFPASDTDPLSLAYRKAPPWSQPVPDGAYFVRAWRHAPSAEPWPDLRSFVPLTPERLGAVTAALGAAELRTSPEAFVDLGGLLRRTPPPRAGYAGRDIVAEAPRKVKLYTGSRGALRVWLNGGLVVSALKLRDPGPDAESVTVDLRAGSNSLLVEVSSAVPDGGFYLRLEDPLGKPLKLSDAGRLEPVAGAR
jgi:WD40 repeat protein